MITVRDIKKFQEALINVLERNVFLRKEINRLFQDSDYSRAEKSWIRDTLHRSVQLKNRYRILVERFTEAVPGRKDDPLDFRLFFMAQFLESKSHSRVETDVYRLLYDKSRVRKFAQFLKATSMRSIFGPHRREDPAYLWEYHSHPLWMVRKWLGLYTYKDVERLCQYNNGLPEVSIRSNPLKTTRDDLVGRFKKEGIRCEASRVSPFGILANRDMDPLNHPGHADGTFTLQSLSSQLVCLYINPKPGMRLLDYCAGEGGKTLLFSHIMKGKGEIYAHDTQVWRLNSLRQRARNENVANIRLEGLRSIRKLGDSFDAVVLDVPCSGSGTFRNQPELKWRLRQEDLFELNSRQLALLDEAIPFCRPGGLMFYITCSIFQEENHKVIRRFLGLHKEWELVTPKAFLEEQHQTEFWVPLDTLRRYTGKSYFQILPHTHGLPGMFCAVLRRTSPPPTTSTGA